MKRNIIFGLLAFFILSGIAIAALVTTNSNYRGYSILNGGSTIGIIYNGDTSADRTTTFSAIREHNICRVVASTNSAKIFIPTKTVNERSAFIAKPPRVSLYQCGCKVNTDCGTSQCCNGYTSAGSAGCRGSFTETKNGICEGIVVGCNCENDGTNCSVFKSLSECHNGWPTHGCVWDSNYSQTKTYSCSIFTTTATCNAKSGCSRSTAATESLGTCGTCAGGGGGNCVAGVPAACFVAETKVKLSDNTSINIEDIKESMKVLGANNQIQIVKKPLKIRYTGKLYAINGSDYFVTASHPFMTTEGWKSFDPDITKNEIPDLIVTKLEIGDVLIKENGLEYLYQTNYKKVNQYVYNLALDGNHTYYADEYLVHNKYPLGPGCVYNVSCASNACVGGVCTATTTTPSVNACCSCTIKAQCPGTYDCVSGRCSKTGVNCGGVIMD